MWQWLANFNQQMVDDYTPQTYAAMVAKNQADLARGAKQYAVIDGSIPVGAIWGELLGDGQFVGHLVFAPDVKNKGEITRQVMRRWFQEGARKVCWQVFADNRVFQNFLKRRIHAQQEGYFHKATRRNGELVDVVVMASFAEDLR